MGKILCRLTSGNNWVETPIPFDMAGYIAPCKRCNREVDWYVFPAPPGTKRAMEREEELYNQHVKKLSWKFGLFPRTNGFRICKRCGIEEESCDTCPRQ